MPDGADLPASQEDGPTRPAHAPRRRGRPNLLDREQILSTALAMLETDGPAGFTMNKLAHRLGASVMTLYTYFPSRDALIDAAGAKIFSTFEPPAEELPWRDAVRAWLWQLYRMFERHPVGLRLIKWDGAVTPSWLKVWMPLMRILTRAGFSGEPLLLAANWVGRVGMALLMAQISARGELTSIREAAERNGALSEADRALLAHVPDDPVGDYSDTLYAFGIGNIVRGLEELASA